MATSSKMTSGQIVTGQHQHSLRSVSGYYYIPTRYLCKRQLNDSTDDTVVVNYKNFGYLHLRHRLTVMTWCADVLETRRAFPILPTSRKTKIMTSLPKRSVIFSNPVLSGPAQIVRSVLRSSPNDRVPQAS